MSNCDQYMTSVYTVPAGYPDTGRQIFVGSGLAAQCGKQLKACDIYGVLNVAYDVDDQPVFGAGNPQLLADPNRPGPEADTNENCGSISRYSHCVQYAKFGLIDGTKNPAGIMALAGAVYMAEQLWSFPSQNTPCPPLVNVYPTDGNLLIHCWSGGSRSVTVAALFAWYKWECQQEGANLASFLTLYNSIKQLRGDSLAPWSSGPCTPSASGVTQSPPTVGMQDDAIALVSRFQKLFPIPAPPVVY